MSRYESYRNSEIDWVGEIPSHWETIKPKHKLNRVTRPIDDDDEVVTCFRDGVVTLRKNRREDGFTNSIKEYGYQQINPGDLVVHEMDGFAGAIGISDSKGKSTPVYTVIEPDHRVDLRFIAYLLREMSKTGKIESLARSIRERTTDFRWNMWSVIHFPFPPIEEQKLISGYIDKKTEQIDRLVEKIQKKIELLKEQRTSLINQFVTKGLDTNVEMKDSDLEWIGEIPRQWKVKKVKYLLENEGIKIGPYGSSLKLDTLVEEGIKIYGQGNVIKNDFFIGHRHLREDDFETNFKQYEILPGDVLVTMMGTTGRSKVFEKSFKKGILDSHLLRLRFDHNQINPNLFSLLLENASYISHQVKLNSKGSIMEGLNSSIVKNISLILPNIEQQDLLLSKLSKLIFSSEELISKKHKKISLLREYRQSLVSSVVTGKVRVTEDIV